ncbi:sugar phosphate isomerase/epimerase [Pedobacter hiemivivus]|uniref:Sugar phosphate isomerase/epimerase n=1 Tax=Pedobacter hiemivivus TaxID=2530454 RepID=A0A4U1GKJ3_9SPHI|nr:sugar phosphate isomerase/epimerase [Pedobacter hiemivivus]TCC99256.1 sugar phosphate isomerase/epimerase [Pedobacter hiemivivus]TKC63899.1 sugar phosphate isomerase/epimerase [Pedobacter hiemivivus]
MKQSRRSFLTQISLLSAAPLLASSNLFAAAHSPIAIQYGYAAITWGNNIKQSIQDISSLGFKGIQLRANAFTEFGQKPDELIKLLKDANLKLAMYSSGNANINTGNDEAEIAKHIASARFVKLLGGDSIQVTNSSRPKSGTVTNEDLIKYAKLLTEIGKQTAAIGIKTTYHNHMGQLGQTPEEVDIILQHSDPKYVKLLLDIAHYQQGGGDPVAAILKYKKRLDCLHIKDVKNTTDTKGYIFVELGQGRVDLPAVLATLKNINYNGYAIVELDAVPVKDRTPLQSGQITRDYLMNTLKVKI